MFSGRRQSTIAPYGEDLEIPSSPIEQPSIDMISTDDDLDAEGDTPTTDVESSIDSDDDAKAEYDG